MTEALSRLRERALLRGNLREDFLVEIVKLRNSIEALTKEIKFLSRELKKYNERKI